MQNDNHISVKNLEFSFPLQEPVLKGVNLDVSPGEKVGIIGPNGSGKTTLFLLLAGMLAPDSGYLSVLDSPVKTGSFNSDLGFVFQNPDDQLFCPTVRDDLGFGLLNLGYSKEETDSMIDAYLTRMGMSDLAGRPPHNLSGGEKRMISIAGVIIMNPTVVLLDEPESSLDSRARRQLIEFLRNSSETLLIASHDLEFLLETCDRTALLDSGKICADGSSRKIMGDEPLMNSHGFEKPHSLVPHVEPHHRI
ncbi:MAG: ATP-binding cassette domain-containing protein [Candidatus Aegiribacteria sp.]|nr:ATP-binding cassette domain-containing protein [Candidatus Aegiribacteria sp.]